MCNVHLFIPLYRAACCFALVVRQEVKNNLLHVRIYNVKSRKALQLFTEKQWKKCWMREKQRRDRKKHHNWDYNVKLLAGCLSVTATNCSSCHWRTDLPLKFDDLMLTQAYKTSYLRPLQCKISAAEFKVSLSGGFEPATLDSSSCLLP